MCVPRPSRAEATWSKLPALVALKTEDTAERGGEGTGLLCPAPAPVAVAVAVPICPCTPTPSPFVGLRLPPALPADRPLSLSLCSPEFPAELELEFEFELRMTSSTRARSASACARFSACPCFDASRDCFMSGEMSEGVIVPVSGAWPWPGAGVVRDEGWGAVMAMAVGLRGGRGGVLPTPEPELTAPECVLARCRKGFVDPGVTGVGAPTFASLALKTDVAVEGVWL